MPLEFIPNQPFIWESPIGTQDCLNNDTRIGSQIVTQGDTICVQQKLLPCDETVNCEPTMSSGAGTSVIGAFTTSGKWTYLAGELTFSGSGTLGSATYTNGALLTGVVYRVEFEVWGISGDANISVSLGSDSATNITELGEYVYYMICDEPTAVLRFISAGGTVADTASIRNINLYNVTTCWIDQLNQDAPGSFISSWTYTLETDDFLTYANGKFCAKEGFTGDLINTNGYVTDGNYHSVEFTITGCTQGGVEVILGGVYLGTTEGNGTFTYYGTPTDTSGELRFRKVDDFDGCINSVNVNDYGIIDSGDLSGSDISMVVIDSTDTAISDKIAWTVYDDRVTWCFDVSTLEFGGNPVTLDCSEVYRLRIVSICGIESTAYASLTVFRYDTAWNCSKVVEAYADGYQLGFYFGATTAPVFRLIQRLRVLQFAPSYPIEGEEYLYSSGVWGRSFGQRGKVRTCHFDYVDEATHDTISAQMLCDVLLIDDVQFYAPTKEYKPEWEDNKYNLAQSRIDLVAVDEKYIFKRNC